MTNYVATSFGAARALAYGPNINHTEFRLLIRLSERPQGIQFEGKATTFFQRDRISPDDLFEAVQRLSSQPFCEPIRLENEVVIWGPFK